MISSTMRGLAPAGLFLLVFFASASPLFGADDALPVAEQVVPEQALPQQAPLSQAPPHQVVGFPLDTLVPLSAQKVIQSKVDRLTGAVRGSFSVWLARSGKYISIMEDIFEEKGLPTDLVFLPLIESGFNPFAVSRAAATGPWQFMAGTAKSYGLAINWWTDERRDPIKATAAAADYLKELYKTFGSWPLALASYNAGEGRVSRALTKAGTDDYWHLMQTRFIPKETRDYVPLYLAAAMIAKNPADHGFAPSLDEIFEFDEVILEESLQLPVAARCAGTTLEKMKELNPALTRNVTPPYKNFILRIPKGTETMFSAALETLSPEERRAWERVKLRKGDTLQRLAKRHNLTVTALKEINSMDGKSRLKTGQYILVPKSMPVESGIKTAQKRTKSSNRS